MVCWDGSPTEEVCMRCFLILRLVSRAPPRSVLTPPTSPLSVGPPTSTPLLLGSAPSTVGSLYKKLLNM